MSVDSAARNNLRKILVVDDEENTRIGLQKLLSTEGYQVTLAGNGHEALDRLKQDCFHLVITDINMPQMNGLLFLQEINRTYPQIRVVMVTAHGEVDTYIEAKNLGVYEYLHKPVKIEDLKLILNKLKFESRALN